MEVLRHQRGWIIALKGGCAGDHFIQDDPKRVDITALIARVATHLFGCNVEWYPKLSSRECGIGRSQEPCKAKVGENGFAHGVACRVPGLGVSGFLAAFSVCAWLSLLGGGVCAGVWYGVVV